MHLTKEDIRATEKIRRLNLINAVSGIKSANLIGTKSKAGHSNLAIFSSIIHLSSNPATIGFMMRPTGEVPRHTFENILETGFYTINHVHESFVEKAHYTSAKFDREESEFEQCQLTETYLFDFKAPFVGESQLKLGMKFIESVPIKVSGTHLIIGEIEHFFVADEAVLENGHIDLSILGDAGISGLNTYYRIEKINTFPYARKEAMPEFKQ